MNMSEIVRRGYVVAIYVIKDHTAIVMRLRRLPHQQYCGCELQFETNCILLRLVCFGGADIRF
jgi:hypothetical protein